MQCGTCHSSGVPLNIGTVQCKTTGHFEENFSLDKKAEEAFVVKGACEPEVLKKLLCDNSQRWTQIFVPEVLCIPTHKPDVEQLITVNAAVQLLSQRVVKTPNSCGLKNEEGTKLTGKKLIIEGILRQKIMYTADVPEQSVHTVHFDVPFSAFIVLNECDSLTEKFSIDICIEDIYVTSITPRQIFKNVTLFIKAKRLCREE